MIKEKNEIVEKLDEMYIDIFEKELIDEIVELGILREIPEGELLIDIGDELTHVPLVVSGAIKILIADKDGHEVLLYHLQKGETCAISFVNCIHRSYSIFKGIAEKDTEGIFIPIEKLDEWLVKYESWRHYIIDSYHFRLIGLVHSIENFAFMSLEERLIKYLINKVIVLNSGILKITHDEIAHELHTARQVISRLLKDLEKQGKIKIRRGRIIIPDLQLFL